MIDTWTCHVCDEERPDRFISVLSTDHISDRGVAYTTNVRYCNDRPRCVDGAAQVDFGKGIGRTGTNRFHEVIRESIRREPDDELELLHHMIIEERSRRTIVDARAPFAQLYFTWHELDELAGLVDTAITQVPPGHSWGMLNSLRTALREAQQHVRPA